VVHLYGSFESLMTKIAVWFCCGCEGDKLVCIMWFGEKGEHDEPEQYCPGGFWRSPRRRIHRLPVLSHLHSTELLPGFQGTSCAPVCALLSWYWVPFTSFRCDCAFIHVLLIKSHLILVKILFLFFLDYNWLAWQIHNVWFIVFLQEDVFLQII